MKWVLSFALGCAAIVVAVVTGLWLVGAFGDMGLSLHGTIALLIGVTITVFLGAGLIALVFYSGRSRHDEAASQHDSPDQNRRFRGDDSQLS